MDEIRALIVDRHPLVRDGLRCLLENCEGVTIVGEASDGRSAVEAVARTEPDFVLMEVDLSGLNGIDAARRLRELRPETHVLILSTSDSELQVARALEAGASGYLLKTRDAEDLERAVRSIIKGEIFLCPCLDAAVVQQCRTGEADEAMMTSELDRLTLRQREVLQLVAEGYTSKAIAAELDISPKTVETHRAAIMDRTGTDNLAGLVRFAIREGLVAADRD